MKYVVLACVCITSVSFSKGQGYIPSNVNQVDGFVEAYDASGQLIGNNLSPEGSPFLYDSWQSGNVSFKSGKVLSGVELKVDLSHNELRLHKDDKSYIMTEPIAEFRIANPEGSSSLFRSGYPSIAKNNEQTFYQVLADGKGLQLVLFRFKSAAQINEYNGPTKTHYTEWDKFYVYDAVNHKMQEVKLDRNYLEKRFPELAPFLDRYEGKQLSLKQLAEAIVMYNQKLSA